MRQAAGFIEMRGLAAAITAADIALKAANIELVGVELTRGMGYAVVKIQGDVGAVRAAVDATTSARETANYFVAKDIIARPSLDLDALIYSKETKGLLKEETSLEEKEEEKEEVVESQVQENTSQDPEEEEERLESPQPDQAEDLKEESPALEEAKEATCNLCHDPACPRQKGEPRADCIHFDEMK